MKKLLILGLLLALGTTVLFGQENISLSKLEKKAQIEARTLYYHSDDYWEIVFWGESDRYKDAMREKDMEILAAGGGKFYIVHGYNVYTVDEEGNYTFDNPEAIEMSPEKKTEEAAKAMKATLQVILKIMYDPSLSQEK